MQVISTILSLLAAVAILSLLARRINLPYPTVMVVAGLAGMRGVISLALASSLPVTIASGAEFPRRGRIIFLTFGIILTTLIFQSLSLPWLVRILKVRAGDELRCEEQDARLQVARAALVRLDEMSSEAKFPSNALQGVRHYYQDQMDGISHTAEGNCSPAQTPLGTIRRELIEVEGTKLLELYDRDVINDAVLGRIETDLDLEELRWPEKT